MTLTYKATNEVSHTDGWSVRTHSRDDVLHRDAEGEALIGIEVGPRVIYVIVDAARLATDDGQTALSPARADLVVPRAVEAIAALFPERELISTTDQ